MVDWGSVSSWVTPAVTIIMIPGAAAIINRSRKIAELETQIKLTEVKTAVDKQVGEIKSSFELQVQRLDTEMKLEFGAFKEKQKQLGDTVGSIDAKVDSILQRQSEQTGMEKALQTISQAITQHTPARNS